MFEKLDDAASHQTVVDTVAALFGQREETSGYDVLVNVACMRVRSLNEVRSVVRRVLPWYGSSSQETGRRGVTVFTPP